MLETCMEINSDFLPLQPGGLALRGCGTKGVWHLSKFVNKHNFVICKRKNPDLCMEIRSYFLLDFVICITLSFFMLDT